MLSLAPQTSVVIGNIKVSFLQDGYTLANPLAVFPNTTKADWEKYSSALDANGRLLVNGGSFLIESDGRRILVDLAGGEATFDIPDLAKSRTGQLLDSLAAVGLHPSDIDAVIYTHLHPDHVGWTSIDGELTFSRARHYVAEAEWKHWFQADPEIVDYNAPDRNVVLTPLQDRIELLADGDTVSPGITVTASVGHTPGHLSVVVRDPSAPDAARLVILGDILHWPGQLTEPEWFFAADHDPAASRKARDGAVSDFADTSVILAVGHFRQVFGRIRTTSDGYTWVPLDDAVR